jgi:thiamine-phosphate pyrophosphorylase
VSSPIPSPQFPIPRLNAIIDIDASTRAGWRPLDVAKAFLQGGATFLQLRGKAIGAGEFLDFAGAVVELATAGGATVVVNDRADVARLSAAAGVHVGQDDLPPADVRTIVGTSALVGLSTHTVEQVDRALAQPITYIAIGPVFGSVTKSTGYDRVGLVMVGEAAKRARSRGVPVVGIGGITLFTAPSVVDAGAASVAVIGDLLTTGNPEARVREYLRVLG